VKGTIFDIQRYSIHDGPGIRTVVFLKGCPLRCPWCENPESQSFRPELLHKPALCVGCSACLAPSMGGIARRTEHGDIKLDRAIPVPEAAVGICPSLAIRVVGWKADTTWILEEVLKDRAFFEKSGGGLTISGGEPLAQADFTLALAQAALAAGLNVAVETCLAATRTSVERLASLPILWLADLKHVDPEKLRKETGCEPDLIAANLDLLSSLGADFILRVPVIPGFNDDEVSMKGILERAAELAGRAERTRAAASTGTAARRGMIAMGAARRGRLDLLCYLELARGKYLALGREYAPAKGISVPTGRLARYAAQGAELGLDINIGG
jgi:pyruvate formate lyase activating enzyme